MAAESAGRGAAENAAVTGLDESVALPGPSESK
jgi:hypothetical protein